MPFLRSTGARKKKSYINDDAEESARRRDMIKQKLYAEHMIDGDDECDDYLHQQLDSRSSAHKTCTNSCLDLCMTLADTSMAPSLPKI